MNKAKIILSAEAGRCPYWDTESNRPTHTCNGCAEPDNPLNVMIDGVRYCLLDIDITGEICRENVPDTNVGKNDGWIPVKERLPEVSGMYYVTDKRGEVNTYGFFDTNSSREYWRINVKAWMQKPEPYTEKE